MCCVCLLVDVMSDNRQTQGCLCLFHSRELESSSRERREDEIRDGSFSHRTVQNIRTVVVHTSSSLEESTPADASNV